MASGKLCSRCNNAVSGSGHRWCNECYNQWRRAWRENNIEEQRRKANDRYRSNPERHKGNVKKFRVKLRNEVLAKYGGICQCCNETTPEFLCIDHINGGGGKHRKQLNKTGQGFYQWLKNNNYPPGFRVLCHNCNMALGHYGYCPHQPPKEEG